MDFTLYAERLKALGRALQQNPEFKTAFKVSPPLSEEDFDYFEEELAGQGLEGFRIWPVFKDFFGVLDGFVLQWEYLGRLPADTKVASAQIALLPSILQPEEQMHDPVSRLYDEARVLDDVSSKDAVVLRFSRERAEPELQYLSAVTGKYHRLSVGFEAYMEMLLEARALYRWQSFFVDDPAFPFTPEQAEKFRTSLKTLFPEADVSKFVHPSEE